MACFFTPQRKYFPFCDDETVRPELYLTTVLDKVRIKEGVSQSFGQLTADCQTASACFSSEQAGKNGKEENGKRKR